MSQRGFGSTHVGRRDNNEDAFLCDPTLGLYAVADGMGGYAGGEVASRSAIQSLQRFFSRADAPADKDFSRARLRAQSPAEARMALAVRQASREIEKQRRGDLGSMGTTVAAILMGQDRALVAHVGDSRVYRMRNRELTVLTKDHTLFEELVDAGVGAAAASIHRSTVTRALGVPGCSKPDLQLIDVAPGDRFLVCSDGLHEVLTPFELTLAILEPKLDSVAERLVHRAYQVGGDDNITAVIVEA